MNAPPKSYEDGIFVNYILPVIKLYDGDFAADAFLVKYEIDDDDKVKIIDEDFNVDVSTFPTYDGLVDPKLKISLGDKAVFRADDKND